jgi:hypothetical protein
VGFALVTTADRLVAERGEAPGGTIGRSKHSTRARGLTELPSLRVPRHGLGGATAAGNLYTAEGGQQPGLTYSRSGEAIGVR